MATLATIASKMPQGLFLYYYLIEENPVVACGTSHTANNSGLSNLCQFRASLWTNLQIWHDFQVIPKDYFQIYDYKEKFVILQ